MSVLTGTQIKERIANDPTFGITPFVESAVQAASYDFHLHPSYCVLPDQARFDSTVYLGAVMEQFNPSILERDVINISPGEFLLALSVERFKFPHDLAGMVKQKSSLGRLGLQVCGDAGWIDPGFEGQLVLELHNKNPAKIQLRSGMPIGQIIYMHTSVDPSDKTDTYNGHYQNQTGFALRSWKKALSKLFKISVDVHNEYVNS